MKIKYPGYHPGASCVCTYNDKRLFIVINLNVIKTYKSFDPCVLTNPELKSTATKTIQNISNSNFFEMDIGGML